MNDCPWLESLFLNIFGPGHCCAEDVPFTAKGFSGTVAGITPVSTPKFPWKVAVKAVGGTLFSHSYFWLALVLQKRICVHNCSNC